MPSRSIKVVLAAGGRGVRRYPITRVIPKAMLPILNRPVLDYAISECVTGGAAEIAIVHQDTDDLVVRYLDGAPPGARMFPLFHFLPQPTSWRYGSAVPVMLASEFVGEAVMYYVAVDDVVFESGGRSLMAQMLTAGSLVGAKLVIAATYVDASVAGRYGVLQTETGTNGSLWLDRIVEKPAQLRAGRHLVYIGRLSAQRPFLSVVNAIEPSSNDGEYRITDAINSYARVGSVLVYPLEKGYYDCGSVRGWLEANRAADRFCPDGPCFETVPNKVGQ